MLRLRVHMNHTYIFDMIICSSQELYPESDLSKSYFLKKHFMAQWLDSNFIPRNSKKFEYRNFDQEAIRIYIENESETRKNEVP